jgi:twitching motility protein PilT
VELNELLMFMTKKGASDLHIKPMRPPLLRIQGRLIPIKANPLQPDEVEKMLGEIMKPGQRARFDERQAVDMGYGVPGIARFRCNIFLQRGTMAGVFRRVPFEIQGVEDLNLPDVIETFTEYPSGLVLVTGPTGSGKSTTLAAMINLIARARQCHVVTIEDPIEFLFQDDKATISQREVGTDTPTFHEALKNCMRQDPDVIMVGEMRDLETMSTAITAAETGHLVFSTLHTNNAAQTVDRIIDSYPADQQLQVRGQLALVLKAIVSMQLVEDHEGKSRLPACEILVNAPKVSKHIENGEIKETTIESPTNRLSMRRANPTIFRSSCERCSRPSRTASGRVRWHRRPQIFLRSPNFWRPSVSTKKWKSGIEPRSKRRTSRSRLSRPISPLSGNKFRRLRAAPTICGARPRSHAPKCSVPARKHSRRSTLSTSGSASSTSRFKAEEEARAPPASSRNNL